MKRHQLLLAVAVIAIVALVYVALRLRAPTENQAVGAIPIRDSRGTPEKPRLSTATPARPAVAPAKIALPAIDAPLADSFAALKALADQGDASAASRLYEQLTSCNKQPALERMFTDALARMQATADTPGISAEDLAKIRTGIDRRRSFLAHLKTRCDGVDATELAELPSITLEAAQLGDAEARTCYIHRGPMANPQAALATPALFSEYAATVRQLIDAALEQGDWHVVDMLRFAYGPDGNSLLSGHTGTDLAMQYRYTRLFRLGATNQSRITALDAELARLASSLSPVQVTDADAWARQSQAEHFHTSSTDAINSNWDACQLSIYL